MAALEELIHWTRQTPDFEDDEERIGWESGRDRVLHLAQETEDPEDAAHQLRQFIEKTPAPQSGRDRGRLRALNEALDSLTQMEYTGTTIAPVDTPPQPGVDDLDSGPGSGPIGAGPDGTGDAKEHHGFPNDGAGTNMRMGKVAASQAPGIEEVRQIANDIYPELAQQCSIDSDNYCGHVAERAYSLFKGRGITAEVAGEQGHMFNVVEGPTPQESIIIDFWGYDGIRPPLVARPGEVPEEEEPEAYARPWFSEDVEEMLGWDKISYWFKRANNLGFVIDENGEYELGYDEEEHYQLEGLLGGGDVEATKLWVRGSVDEDSILVIPYGWGVKWEGTERLNEEQKMALVDILGILQEESPYTPVSIEYPAESFDGSIEGAIHWLMSSSQDKESWLKRASDLQGEPIPDAGVQWNKGTFSYDTKYFDGPIPGTHCKFIMADDGRLFFWEVGDDLKPAHMVGVKELMNRMGLNEGHAGEWSDLFDITSDKGQVIPGTRGYPVFHTFFWNTDEEYQEIVHLLQIAFPSYEKVANYDQGWIYLDEVEHIEEQPEIAVASKEDFWFSPRETAIATRSTTSSSENEGAVQLPPHDRRVLYELAKYMRLHGPEIRWEDFKRGATSPEPEVQNLLEILTELGVATSTDLDPEGGLFHFDKEELTEVLRMDRDAESLSKGPEGPGGTQTLKGPPEAVREALRASQSKLAGLRERGGVMVDALKGVQDTPIEGRYNKFLVTRDGVKFWEPTNENGEFEWDGKPAHVDIIRNEGDDPDQLPDDIFYDEEHGLNSIASGYLNLSKADHPDISEPYGVPQAFTFSSAHKDLAARNIAQATGSSVVEIDGEEINLAPDKAAKIATYGRDGIFLIMSDGWCVERWDDPDEPNQKNFHSYLANDFLIPMNEQVSALRGTFIGEDITITPYGGELEGGWMTPNQVATVAEKLNEWQPDQVEIDTGIYNVDGTPRMVMRYLQDPIPVFDQNGEPTQEWLEFELSEPHDTSDHYARMYQQYYGAAVA